jgi:hypothetical protein
VPKAQPIVVGMPGVASLSVSVPHRGERAMCLAVPPGMGDVLPITITIARPGRPSVAGDAHDPRATGLELVEIHRGHHPDCEIR